ncbi:hypothetical protein E2C01_058936 [Portunus trituberculatus]|uniref:Uncharacterized protein n=1 Tax=Portunus trituberculatus TaxID=210409 RepID=A0A5B7H5H9_PORTR|nr:hypothetical protein [Portunus trituberculatus]
MEGGDGIAVTCGEQHMSVVGAVAAVSMRRRTAFTDRWPENEENFGYIVNLRPLRPEHTATCLSSYTSRLLIRSEERFWDVI